MNPHRRQPFLALARQVHNQSVKGRLETPPSKHTAFHPPVAQRESLHKNTSLPQHRILKMAASARPVTDASLHIGKMCNQLWILVHVTSLFHTPFLHPGVNISVNSTQKRTVLMSNARGNASMYIKEKLWLLLHIIRNLEKLMGSRRAARMETTNCSRISTPQTRNIFKSIFKYKFGWDQLT